MKTYTVIPSGAGIYSVHDQATGAQLSRFNIPGRIVSGPIVSSETCSITTAVGQTKTTYIIKLPSGMIVNRFYS